MTVRLAVLQHEPQTGLGRFEELLADFELEYEIVSTRGPLPDTLVFDAALCLGGSLAANDASLLRTRRWIRSAAARRGKAPRSPALSQRFAEGVVPANRG